MRCIVQQAGARRGHLKTLGTQMGYSIRVLIWVVVETNDQTIFWSILSSRRCQLALPNLFPRELVFCNKIVDF